jgi:hypothetical protein
MIIELIDEAVKSGARREKACALLGLSARGVARWRAENGGEDGRAGPMATPAHALTDEERKLVLDTANRPEFRNLSPRQIVPLWPIAASTLPASRPSTACCAKQGSSLTGSMLVPPADTVRRSTWRAARTKSGRGTSRT